MHERAEDKAVRPGRFDERPSPTTRLSDSRPDRAEKVTVTTHCPAGLRDSYKHLGVDCGATMGELQLAALRLMLHTRFKGVPRSERRRVWQTIESELERAEGDD